MKTGKFIFPLLFFLAFLGGCSEKQAAEENSGIANPASEYCEEQGNTLQIITAPDGSQYGACVFPDGSACEEWAYFRGECAKAYQP